MKDGFVSSIRCPDWHHIWLFARNVKQRLPGGFGGARNFLRSHLKPFQPQVVTAVSPWGIGSSGRLESCVYQLVMNMRVEEEERRWSSGKKPFSIGGLYIVWICVDNVFFSLRFRLRQLSAFPLQDLRLSLYHRPHVLFSLRSFSWTDRSWASPRSVPDARAMPPSAARGIASSSTERRLGFSNGTPNGTHHPQRYHKWIWNDKNTIQNYGWFYDLASLTFRNS